MEQKVCYYHPILIFLLVIGFIMIPDSASAQIKSLSLGARLGINNSSAFFEDEQAGDRIDSRGGLQFGGVVGYELNSILALQLELLFIEKGWKEQGTGGERKLTYLDLPLLLAISTPWKTSPQLLVGPSLSYELSCSVRGVPGVGVVSGNDPRVEWEREKFLLGIWFGLGLSRQLGNGKLGLQFLGNISLTAGTSDPLPSLPQ